MPISENLQVDYVSNNSKISHKCGHDGHLTILLNLAEKLQFRNFCGTVVLLFQAEEETGTGAAKVLNDSRFLELNIESVYGLHNLPGFNENSIIVRDGAFASASKGLIIELFGKSSHAAEPENGNSPAIAMTSIINTLVTLPQRNTSFNDSNLVTVIHAKLGEEAFGTSPGDAVIMATLRSDSEINMSKMTKDIERISHGLANAFKLKCNISYKEVFPATSNHSSSNAIVKLAAEQLELQVIDKEKAFPWSEDFGHYLNFANGAFFGLGAGLNSPSLHNPEFDFNDNIIETGSNMFWEILKLENGKI